MNRLYWGVSGVGILGFAAAIVYFAQGVPPAIPPKRGCDLTMAPRGTLVRGVSGTAQTLTFKSRSCSTGTVTVKHGGSTVGTCTLSGGACTYSDTLPDLATTTITGSITSGSVTHSDALVAVVDALNPEITLTSPNVAPDGSLIVVSGVIDATGVPLNSHVEANDPGYYPDALPGTDGGGHVTVTAVVTGGSDGGSLVTSWGGTQLAATALTMTPQTVTQSITLPEGAVGVLTLTATIGSGSTALAIPVMIDTLVPPTPVTTYGVSDNPDGGCAPCTGDSSGCTNGCHYHAPADGSGWTHVVNDRHADLEFAVTIPPDAGPLWGDPTTGAIETQFCCLTETQIMQNITNAVVYPDAGLVADAPYPDGGAGIDFGFAAAWMCTHHDAGALVRWTP